MSETTERLHLNFSLSCIGEGNGNPLQCSCLENPRDGRAWWAAVYGVAQGRTRLKRLSSSSRSRTTSAPGHLIWSVIRPWLRLHQNSTISSIPSDFFCKLEPNPIYTFGFCVYPSVMLYSYLSILYLFSLSVKTLLKQGTSQFTTLKKGGGRFP